jgi:hypothetical protein
MSSFTVSATPASAQYCGVLHRSEWAPYSRAKCILLGGKELGSGRANTVRAKLAGARERCGLRGEAEKHDAKTSRQWLYPLLLVPGSYAA